MPSRSLHVPENTFVIEAVASAMPSRKPTVVTLAPSAVTRNTGRSEWIISDETSMNRLTNPSAHTPRGIDGRSTGAARVAGDIRSGLHRCGRCR